MFWAYSIKILLKFIFFFKFNFFFLILLFFRYLISPWLAPLIILQGKIKIGILPSLKFSSGTWSQFASGKSSKNLKVSIHFFPYWNWCFSCENFHFLKSATSFTGNAIQISVMKTVPQIEDSIFHDVVCIGSSRK